MVRIREQHNMTICLALCKLIKYGKYVFAIKFSFIREGVEQNLTAFQKTNALKSS